MWLIDNAVDTTVTQPGTTYDRMVSSKSMAEDYEEQSGTLRLDEVFNLAAMGLTAT